MVISNPGFLHINSRLSREDVERIRQIEEGWCVSVYAPFHADPRERPADILELRGLESRVRKELALRTLSPRDIENLMAPLERMVEGEELSHLQGKGVAVFSSRQGSAVFLLPDAPPNSAAVDMRFSLDPLIPMLAEDEGFCLLAIGLHTAHLWEGNRSGLREVPLHGSHIHVPRTPIIDRHEAESFCRSIDDFVLQRIGGRHLPLILAGSNPLLATYRRVSACKEILEDAIIGNPDSEAVASRLHESAWICLRETRRRELNQLLRWLSGQWASAKTASGITDVLPCADGGSIQRLFVRKGYTALGRYIPATGQVVVHPVQELDSENLVNLACLRTLLAGGKVDFLDAERMPAGSDIAAICRF